MTGGIDDRIAYPINSNDAKALRQLTVGYSKIITDTAYTLTNADIGLDLFFQNSSAITVTVPSGLDENFRCRMFQDSTGQVTFAQGSGVTLNAFSGWKKSAGQHAGATLTNRGSNVFNLAGNLTA